MKNTPYEAGLMLSTNSNYDQIRNLIKRSSIVSEGFTSYKISDIEQKINDYQVDILFVSDYQLSNHNFQLLRTVAAKVEIVIMLEAHELNFPTAFLPFHLLHPVLSFSLFESMMGLIANGGHAYDNILHQAFRTHAIDLSAPSDYGLTGRHVVILNLYISSKSQSLIAKELNISLSTVKSTLQAIKSKLGLKSFSEFVPFLKTKHWCHFETGEIIWF
ncbi:MAG: response regulator transcription factor [Flavobacteriales bacterium]|nr:response regulator transcription factor [Flavobacteriales bacterium]